MDAHRGLLAGRMSDHACLLNGGRRDKSGGRSLKTLVVAEARGRNGADAEDGASEHKHKPMEESPAVAPAGELPHTDGASREEASKLWQSGAMQKRV